MSVLAAVLRRHARKAVVEALVDLEIAKCVGGYPATEKARAALDLACWEYNALTNRKG